MDKTVFVVDDSATNLATASEALEGHYNVITISSGEKAIHLLKKVKPDLILLDIEMPVMDGFDVLNYLKADEIYRNIPVICLTSMVDPNIEIMALERGVVDFIAKPFSAPVLLNRIRVHMDINGIIRERTHQLNSAKHDIVFVLADVVENRDELTGDHLGRTSRLVHKLVTMMQKKRIYEEQISEWEPALTAEHSLLHDVGKINTPDSILKKPDKLTAEEYEIMKNHALAGKKIIDKIIKRSGENVFLQNSLLFALYHHERWDGTGYPFGLKGEEIPLQGRIMAIVDVYDALTSTRPYKAALTDEVAVEIIKAERGRQFDPEVVDAFLEIKNRIKDA